MPLKFPFTKSKGEDSRHTTSFVEVDVCGVGMTKNIDGVDAPVVILKSRQDERYVMFFIGLQEAAYISRYQQGQSCPRPLTIDLVASIIAGLEATLQSVAIVDFKNNTYYARLQLYSHFGQLKEIDCRPSDAIAIALRTKAPIYMNQHLLIYDGPFENSIMVNDQLADQTSNSVPITAAADSPSPFKS